MWDRFTQCLDAVKSGLVVKDEVFKRDKANWDREPPACFPSKTEDDGSKGQKLPLKPRKISCLFILEVLRGVAAHEAEAYKTRLGKLRDRYEQSYLADQDLIYPLKEAEERVRKHPQFERELQRIKAHVDKYREHFIQTRGNLGEFSTFARHGKKSKKQVTIGEEQESIRAVSEAYTRNLPTELVMFDDAAVRRVAASYAYQLDYTRTRGHGVYNFCFAVAWAELCAIKARAAGGSFVTLAPGYMDSMAIHKKMAKVFREIEDGGDEEREDGP
jgi:RNA-dependent RNA polymerase